MSKYEALISSIRLLEALEKMDVEGARGVLQDIAKDVRYGGTWEGDYEKVAEVLDHCEKMECYACPYKSIEACKAELKHDAALAIRQLAKDKKETEQAANQAIEEKLNYIEELKERIEELEEQIAIMSEGAQAEEQITEEPREPAEWQGKLMGNPELGKLRDVLPF